ncbi:MAG TPA: hypothetical protein VNA20_08470 [Frankiaceae bacterium]|nr:hypothetical protein [Frankiaceae bacterium]
MIVIVLVLLVVVLTYVRPRVLAQPPGVLARLPMLAPVPASALTPPAPWRATAVRAMPAWPATLALARTETRRVLLSPLFTAAVVITVLNAVVMRATTEFATFNSFALGGPAAFWAGLICYFAGHAAASRSRRSGTGEMFAPAPLSPRLRILALALASLVAGAVIFVLLLAGYLYWWDVRDIAFTRPTIWHLLSTPVQVVGGFTFGVMLATWAPWRGVAPAGFFGLVAVHVILSNTGNPAWGAFYEYAKWPDQGGGFETLSAAWHLAYMALLCAMAVVGAMVWLPGRRRGLLALGAALTLGALGAGLAQF